MFTSVSRDRLTYDGDCAQYRNLLWPRARTPQLRQRYGSTRTVRDIDPRLRQWAASTWRGTWREPGRGRRTAVVEPGHVGAPARTWPPKLRDTILAYPTMAAGPGSLFSDVPSYRRCEATMAHLTGKVAIVTGASKGLGWRSRRRWNVRGPPLQSIVPREGTSGTKVTRQI